MSRDRVVIWPRATEAAGRSSIVERARRRGFRRFVGPDGPPAGAPSGEVWWSEREGAVDRRDGSPPVPIARVGSPEGLAETVARTRSGAPLAIEWVGDRVIPSENAVAAGTGTREVWVVAHHPSEVPAALGALEHGADLVLVQVDRPELVETLEALLDAPPGPPLDRTEVSLVEVAPAGLGDRVIVDTTSLLRPDEGLLVGSAAAFLFLVGSEASGSKFSRPRPFRVNAGAAHSYVLLADGSTRYLAELAPGDAVLVMGASGSVRSVRVGRLKTERRPLVLAVADVEGLRRTIFLQEAESVRLLTPTGPVATTELSPGLRVHGARLPPARHLGQAVEEAIDER